MTNPTYTSVKYAFTITLHPSMYKLPIDEQYDQTYLELITRLKSLPTKVCLIAEITQYNYNVHYHGTMQFIVKSKDHQLDFINLFRQSKIFGFKNIKQVDDEDGWKSYIIKDLDKTRILLCRPPVIIDEFDNYVIQGITENKEFMFHHDLISQQ